MRPDAVDPPTARRSIWSVTCAVGGVAVGVGVRGRGSAGDAGSSPPPRRRRKATSATAATTPAIRRAPPTREAGGGAAGARSATAGGSSAGGGAGSSAAATGAVVLGGDRGSVRHRHGLAGDLRQPPGRVRGQGLGHIRHPRARGRRLLEQAAGRGCVRLRLLAQQVVGERGGDLGGKAVARRQRGEPGMSARPHGGHRDPEHRGHVLVAPARPQHQRDDRALVGCEGVEGAHFSQVWCRG